MGAEELVELLRGNGIKAAEEYFPEGAQLPYAVVLEAEGSSDGPDMCVGLLEITQRFRIELYTKSKKDPIRKEFRRIIHENIAPLDRFYYENESYGAGRMYLTAIEFDQMIEENF